MSNRDGKYDHWHWKAANGTSSTRTVSEKFTTPGVTTKTSPTSPKRTTQKRQWTRITKIRQTNFKAAHTQVTVALKVATLAGTSPCETPVRGYTTSA